MEVEKRKGGIVEEKWDEEKYIEKGQGRKKRDDRG